MRERSEKAELKFPQRGADVVVAVKVAQQEVKERTSHISLIREGRGAAGRSGDAARRARTATKTAGFKRGNNSAAHRARGPVTSSSFPFKLFSTNVSFLLRKKKKYCKVISCVDASSVGPPVAVIAAPSDNGAKTLPSKSKDTRQALEEVTC